MKRGKERTKREEKRWNKKPSYLATSMFVLAAFLTMFSLISFLDLDSPTGFAALETYTQEIDQEFMASSQKPIAFIKEPSMLRITGKVNIQQNGYVKVWLTDNQNKYLIFDSKSVDDGSGGEISFYNLCEETCSIVEFPVYGYLDMEIQDASIDITKIQYQSAKENNPSPEYTGPSTFTIQAGKTFTLHLSPYWKDNNGKDTPLIFLATNDADLDMDLSEDTITIQTSPDMKKDVNIKLIANDGTTTVKKDVLLRIDSKQNQTKVLQTNVDVNLKDEYGRDIGSIKKVEKQPGVYKIEAEIQSEDLQEKDSKNTIVIEGLKSTEQEVNIQVGNVIDQRMKGDTINIENIEIDNATITQEITGEINAIYTCKEENFDKIFYECNHWERSGLTFITEGKTVTYSPKHFTAFAPGLGTNLTIYDQGDPEGGSSTLPVGEDITFFANFTNTTGLPANTTNGHCSISFNETGMFASPPENMTFNSTINLSTYQRYFNISGLYHYNITCSGAGETISAIDNLTVDLVCGSILNVDTNLTQNLTNRTGATDCLTIGQDDVTLDCKGFSLLGNGSSSSDAIISQGTRNNITIQNCNIDNWNIGIGKTLVSFVASNSLIRNNTIKNTQLAGISLSGSNNTIFSNSISEYGDQGISFVTNNQNNTISSNTLENASSGTAIVLPSSGTSSNYAISNNTFRNNNRGINLQTSAQNTLIYHNQFFNSTEYHANDAGTSNFWNTSISGTGQGNFWDDAFSLIIGDSNGDGWGDSGSQWPYNATNNGNVTGVVNDFAPEVFICGDTITTGGRVGVLASDIININKPVCLTISADDLTLDCRGYSISGVGVGIAILSENRTNITVKNCFIDNFESAIVMYNVTEFTARNNTITNHVQRGILLQTSNTDSIIDNNSFEHITGNATTIIEESRDTISNNYYNNNTVGIYLSKSQNTTITNNTLFNHTDSAIIHNASNRTRITLNRITFNGRSNSPSPQVYFTNFQEQLTISSNNVSFSQNNSGIGSDIDGVTVGTGWTITGNNLQNNSGSGIELLVENSTISNNVIENNGIITSSTGLLLQGNNNNITSNTIRNNKGNGSTLIQDNLRITNNVISNNTQNGLVLRGVDSANISTNNLEENGNNGLYVIDFSGDSNSLLSINDNIIQNNSQGILLNEGVSNSTFSSNNLSTNTYTQINLSNANVVNNSFISNIFNGSPTSIGLFISAGSSNLFALNIFRTSSILAQDIAGGNFYTNASLGNTGGGNDWEDVPSLQIFDSDLDGFGEQGTDLPYSPSTSTRVLGLVSDERPITSKRAITPPEEPPKRRTTGPASSSAEIPAILQRPKSGNKTLPLDEEISCLVMNGSILTSLLSKQVDIPENLNIPPGFKIIKGPFALYCNGADLDITFNVPDNYENLKVLRCKDNYCTTISKTTTDNINLYCGASTLYEIVKEKRDEKESKVMLPKEYEAIGGEKAAINNERKVISSGRVKIAFSPKETTILGFNASITIPQEAVQQPKNPSVEIVGTPRIVQIRSQEQQRENIPAQIVFGYPEIKNIEEESIELFYFKNNQWNLIPSKQNKKERTIEASTENIKEYEENKTILLATIGVKCVACKESILKREYTYSNTRFKQIYNYEGSREAFVLVHGLMSSPGTFEYIIHDFEYNKQPGQIWTFEYASNSDFETVAKELIDNIELHLDEYDTIHFVGHSLGALIVQKGLAIAQERKNQDPLQYHFLDKTKKAILIASPNKGTQDTRAYEELFKYFINEESDTTLFNIRSNILEQIKNGINISKVSSVDYYVMAGTESYNFNIGPINIDSAKILDLEGENDGITTVDNAQFIGGTYINNSCEDYYEVDLTHTELITNPSSIKVIERLLTKEIAQELQDEPILGYNQYLQASIEECSNDEFFIIIGTPLDEKATYDPLNCNCGNNVCGVGENEVNCPQDCAVVETLPGVCLIMPITVNVFAIIVILLFIAYLVKKYLFARHTKKTEKRTKELEYVTYFMLLLLAISTGWTRFVCKKWVPYAYIILFIGVLYILFVELEEYFEKKKRKERIKEGSVKGLLEERSQEKSKDTQEASSFKNINQLNKNLTLAKQRVRQKEIGRYTKSEKNKHKEEQKKRKRKSLQKIDTALLERKRRRSLLGNFTNIFKEKKKSTKIISVKQTSKTKDPELEKIDKMIQDMKKSKRKW